MCIRDSSSYAYKSCRPDADTYFKESLADFANIKFRPAQGAYADYKVGGAADHCCMRVEEMYFIEAEATAQAGDLAGGIRLLNEFMTSYRMMNGATYDCTSKSGTLEAVSYTHLDVYKRQMKGYASIYEGTVTITKAEGGENWFTFEVDGEDVLHHSITGTWTCLLYTSASASSTRRA